MTLSLLNSISLDHASIKFEFDLCKLRYHRLRFEAALNLLVANFVVFWFFFRMSCTPHGPSVKFLVENSMLV